MTHIQLRPVTLMHPPPDCPDRWTHIANDVAVLWFWAFVLVGFPVFVALAVFGAMRPWEPLAAFPMALFLPFLQCTSQCGCPTRTTHQES